MARKKIIGVTICINYAGYLNATIRNAKHFDAWIIVTVPLDAPTQMLAQRNGLTILVTERLGPRGELFNAVNTKSFPLNEALSTIASDCWALIVDADILLPVDFRHRLELLELSERKLYGLAGRRMCIIDRASEVLSRSESWIKNLHRNESIIGYFNLFYMGQPNNRYVEQPPSTQARRGLRHDDNLFQKQFKRGLTKTLPMSALHMGASVLNWAGRKTATFEQTNNRRSYLLDCLQLLPVHSGVILQLGFYPPGEDTIALHSHGFSVILIDTYGLSFDSTDDLERADRSHLLQMYLETCGDKFERILPFELHALQECCPFPVAAVYFHEELTYEDLPKYLAALQPYLGETSLLIGKYYGEELFPDSTIVLKEAVGRPSAVFPDGHWIQTWGVANSRKNAIEMGESASLGAESSVVAVCDALDQEIGLHVAVAMKLRLQIPIMLCVSGIEEPALKLACKRFDIAYSYVHCPKDLPKAALWLLYLLRSVHAPSLVVTEGDNALAGNFVNLHAVCSRSSTSMFYVGGAITSADIEATRTWLPPSLTNILSAGQIYPAFDCFYWVCDDFCVLHHIVRKGLRFSGDATKVCSRKLWK